MSSARRRNKDRGYGAEHQALRKQWVAKVANGGVLCARCGHTIWPGQPWDLDHTDDRTGYLGASHARCNRAAPRRRKRITRALQRVSRDW